jgi:peptidoglycan/xylan/chitin deacetylase (PgdA/CDA1 family)
MSLTAPLRIALTFDAEHPDRPSTTGVAEGLLDLLTREGVRATFFIQGRWAEAYPGLARSIADAGHLIGNHSHYHARMPLLTDAGLAEDIADATAKIVSATGVDPHPWFRCPFGAGSDDPRVQAAVEAAGYRHVGWHVAAEDWEPDRLGPAIEADVIRGISAHGDGTVILFHTWPRGMLAAMPGIIARSRDAGATFVGVDELETLPTLPSWA